jgi:hypothetical protein
LPPDFPEPTETTEEDGRWDGSAADELRLALDICEALQADLPGKPKGDGLQETSKKRWKIHHERRSFPKPTDLHGYLSKLKGATILK